MRAVNAEACPDIGGFIVARAGFVAGKNADGQPFERYAQNFGQKVKRPAYRLFFEIVAQRPVAEHFKESAMRRVAHFLYIARANAYLHVGKSCASRVLFAQKIRNERMHSRRGEQNGRVVFRDKRCRRDNSVSPFGKKV